jgi:hypothetical protein
VAITRRERENTVIADFGQGFKGFITAGRRVSPMPGVQRRARRPPPGSRDLVGFVQRHDLLRGALQRVHACARHHALDDLRVKLPGRGLAIAEHKCRRLVVGLILAEVVVLRS